MGKAVGLKLTAAERWIRASIVAIATIPILIAWLYVVGVALPLPPCPFRYFTGIPCPTCGMTRSLLALAHGDFIHAVAEHLFGPLVFLGFLGAIGHCLWELRVGRPVSTVYTRLLVNQHWQMGFAIAVGVYYIGRLWYWAYSGELQLAIANAPLTHLLQGLSMLN